MGERPSVDPGKGTGGEGVSGLLCLSVHKVLKRMVFREDLFFAVLILSLLLKKTAKPAYLGYLIGLAPSLQP